MERPCSTLIHGCTCNTIKTKLKKKNIIVQFRLHTSTSHQKIVRIYKYILLYLLSLDTLLQIQSKQYYQIGPLLKIEDYYLGQLSYQTRTTQLKMYCFQQTTRKVQFSQTPNAEQEKKNLNNKNCFSPTTLITKLEKGETRDSSHMHQIAS